jgi:hypothetical protein
MNNMQHEEKEKYTGDGRRKNKKFKFIEEVDENEDFGVRFLVDKEKRALNKQPQRSFEPMMMIPNNQNFEMIDEYKYKTSKRTMFRPVRQRLLPNGGGEFDLPSRDQWLKDFRSRFENYDTMTKSSPSSQGDRPMTRKRKDSVPMTH